MANKRVFGTYPGALLPGADTRNEHGAPSYRFTPEHSLAHYAATGCLNDTFYASAETQLEAVLKLCGDVEPEFIAKAAIHARKRGLMKDLPALLCSALAVKSPELLERAFPRVIDSPRMLRNFVQMVRSGVTGRKSLGSRPKRLVLRWLDSRGEEALFRAAIGESPSLADIVKMVHPHPEGKSREAFYGWLLGRPHDAEALPGIVREYEAFKDAAPGSRPKIPDVPFQYLTSLELDKREWKSIAERVSWQTLRMNLNTFLRHGVFEDAGTTRLLAGKLRDPLEVSRAKVFPYQLLCAYRNADGRLPSEIREALQDALDAAVANVPEIEGKVFVFPDVSGSMRSPVTGSRKGSTSKVQCVDVAALVASAMLRRNKDAEIVAFSDDVVPCVLNPRDSVVTNSEKLAGLPSGGTDCSAPLRSLNGRKAGGDLVVYVSDNQSWVDTVAGGAPTATMTEWARFKRRSPNAKMVCVNIQPYGEAQAKPGEDILHVAGFSDQVFDLMAAIASGNAGPDWWVDQIREVEL
ncbi:MAG: RNA-binding protein [Candidatus Lindowbacteria bacterium]|nr:RNA-binding protein [Candidatus Lindowbacteria bacterium]